MERTIASLLLSLLLPAAALAQDAGDDAPAPPAAPAPTIEAALSHPTTLPPIEVGETVELSIDVTHPPGATVTFPTKFEPERWGLLDTQRVPSADAERATSSTWVLTFGLFRPGSTTLRPFDVVVDARGGKTTLQTQPVELKVASIFADGKLEPEFQAPRPPVEVWVDDYTLAVVAGGGAFLALLGFAGWAIRRRQLMQPAPPPPPRDPHEIALEKLGALAGGDLIERGEYMVFWVRMSEAIREYLGRTYGFSGTEMTTTELKSALRDVRWPTGIGEAEVFAFLRRCDEVKFGGAVPNLDESTTTLRQAFSVVELTKPRPIVAALTEDVDTSNDDVPQVAENADAPDADDPDARWQPPADRDGGSS